MLRFQGRTRVVQRCFAAVATVVSTLGCIDIVENFDPDKTAPKLHEEARKVAGR